MKTLATIAALVLAQALAGCAAESASPDDDTSLATTEGALRTIGTGPRMGFTCSGLMCTCTGDADCNDMFTNGGCGPIASCDDSGPEPICSCLRGLGGLRVVTAGAPTTVTAVDGGTATMNAAP
jgi:hypothetical protein